MIYFKRFYFKNDSERQEIESALRRFAIRKHTSLDFKSAATDVGTEKRFLGLEGKADLKFTRLRTSFERWIPKLIISFPKNSDQLYYKIRLSFLTSIVFGLFSVGFGVSLLSLLAGRASIEKFSTVVIVVTGYLLLVLLEFEITKSRIRGVIRKHEDQRRAINNINTTLPQRPLK